jgi:hypothetical protein
MYSPKGYEARAEECVRLANLAKDPLVQADLLKLRQTYLVIAERLSRPIPARDTLNSREGTRKP